MYGKKAVYEPGIQLRTISSSIDRNCFSYNFENLPQKRTKIKKKAQYYEHLKKYIQSSY